MKNFNKILSVANLKPVVSQLPISTVLRLAHSPFRCFIIFCCLLLTGCNGPDDVFKKANELNIKGSYIEATELYKQVIKMKPDFGAAYNNRAMTFEKLGKPENASDDYLKAIELDPS